MQTSQSYEGSTVSLLGLFIKTVYLQPGNEKKHSDKPDLSTLATTLQNMQAHATRYNARSFKDCHTKDWMST